MRKQRLILTVLSGICALIWLVNIVIEIVNKAYLERRSTFTFNAIVTGLWIISFILQVLQYRKMLKEE